MTSPETYEMGYPLLLPPAASYCSPSCTHQCNAHKCGSSVGALPAETGSIVNLGAHPSHAHSGEDLNVRAGERV
jgi:hypothetical protein